MHERYEPASDFLRAVIADEVPLSGNSFAEENLLRLIAMTRDADRSNRDWATMLLSQTNIDRPEVRDALIEGAHDDDAAVRAEAILGLAQRDRQLALPFVQEALSGDSVLLPVFEAAGLVADASLVELLKDWVQPSSDDFLDKAACDALAACENGQPIA